MNQLNLRTTVAIVTVGAMISSIAGGIVAFQMLIIANADKTVPDIVPTLIVELLLLTVLLMGLATALRRKLPTRSK